MFIHSDRVYEYFRNVYHLFLSRSLYKNFIAHFNLVLCSSHEGSIARKKYQAPFQHIKRSCENLFHLPSPFYVFEIDDTFKLNLMS